ncbi:MAG: hypothetical protein ACR2JR_16620 [Rubrobacteraceae bacterium]
MTGEGIAEVFERAGWEVQEEGDSAEVVGGAGRYEIRPDEKVLGHETVFELSDEKLSMKAYARKVPTPERAAELLDHYGVPSGMSDATPGKVPMVPPGAEEDG